MTYTIVDSRGQVVPPKTPIPREKFGDVVIICYRDGVIVGSLLWNGERWVYQEQSA